MTKRDLGEEAVVAVTTDGVTELRLNEVATRNALSEAIKRRLEVLIPAFFADPAARCLLITGVDDAFCAGGDIASLAGPQSPAATRVRMARSHGWIRQLIDGEKPVVTAVNGPAVGAGFGLALLGDVILASDRAWFRAGFPAIGVAADYGIAHTLPRAIGAVRAKDILLTDRKVDAAEALAMGLVSRVVAHDDLPAVARALAHKLAAKPTVGLGLTKRLVNAGFRASAADFLEDEGLAQAIAFSTNDFAEGVAAFVAKRAPAFAGR